MLASLLGQAWVVSSMSTDPNSNCMLITKEETVEGLAFDSCGLSTSSNHLLCGLEWTWD